jgi:uncharacterized protein YdgA (DUF945 family)
MRVVRPILAVVMLVLAFLPFYGGYEAERAYLDLVERIRAGAAGQVEVGSEFHRGWLQSTAVTRFGGNGPDDPRGVEFHHTFVHGPIPFGELLAGRLPTSFALAVIESDFRPKFAERSPWMEGLAGRPLVRFRTTLERSGWIELVVESPAIQLETGDSSLAWDGIQGSALVSPDFARVSGAIEAPSLELHSDGQLLRMAAASLEFANETSANGLPEGAVVFSLAELSSERAGAAGFRLRNGSLHARNDEDLAFDSYEMRVGGAFDELSSDGDRFGPGAVELAVRNLKASALRELGEQIEALAAQHHSGGEVDLASLNAGLTALPKLVELSPEIALTRFELTGEEGALAGTASIGIDGEKAHGMPFPLALSLAVEADASFFVPAKMFHRAAETYLMASSGNDGPIPPNQTRQDLEAQAALMRSQLVNSFLEAGHIVREGGGYRIRARLREGQLWLNGRPTGPSGLGATPASGGAATAFPLPY